MIRLLIADDHAVLRSGLKQIFSLVPDISVTGEASNGLDVLRLIQNQEFDLLLLDMTMDGISGEELIRKIRLIRSTLPILMLSMHRVSEMAMIALKAGANGYITKDSEMEDLLDAIRKVASGGKFVDPFLAEEIVYNTTLPIQVMPHLLLSSREFEVFRMLVSGVTIKQISEKLLLSNKTISTYKTRIMEKMNIQNMAELVRYAVQHNLK